MKDRQLWQPEYASFEDYCETVGIGQRATQNNVTRAAKVAQILGPPFPANETIARELAKVVEEIPSAAPALSQRIRVQRAKR
jgi:hypothetical protein